MTEPFRKDSLVRFRSDADVPPLMRGHYAEFGRDRLYANTAVPSANVWLKFWLSSVMIWTTPALFVPVPPDIEARYRLFYENVEDTLREGVAAGEVIETIKAFHAALQRFLAHFHLPLADAVYDSTFWLAMTPAEAIQGCGLEPKRQSRRLAKADEKWEALLAASARVAAAVNQQIDD